MRQRVAVGETTEAPESEMIRLETTVVGEMAVDDVPLPAGFDIEALTAGDDDPLQVVVCVEAGKSKRGWYYTEKVLDRIAGEVNNGGLPGYKGHLTSEEVGHKFVDPVTHWIAAKREGSKLYIRGLVDSSAKDLKRWIRGRRITQTSIFGIPTTIRAGGETRVVDYEPISNDWTPLKRAGMNTTIVALGEIDSITEPGKQAPEPTEGEDMTLEEMLAEMRKNKVAPDQVIGEMGWKQEDVLKAVEVDTAAGEQAVEVLEKIGEVYGEIEADKLVDTIREDHEKAGEVRKGERTKVVDEVLKDKVVGEVATSMVRDLLKGEIAEDASKDDVEKAVGEIMERPHIKSALMTAKSGPTPSPTSDNRTTDGGVPAGLTPQSKRI